MTEIPLREKFTMFEREGYEETKDWNNVLNYGGKFRCNSRINHALTIRAKKGIVPIKIEPVYPASHIVN
jgi:phage tail sheath protein FI